MKATTEMEIKVSGGRIISTDIRSDGTCKLLIEIEPNEMDDTTQFRCIKISELLLTDPIMQYEPFKSTLVPALKAETLKDFYIPGMDPSFDEEENIQYVVGEKPAVGKSFVWWNESALKFMPNRNSRLGTKVEYVAFLATLVKKLTERGWNYEKALNSVIRNSKELGNYENSVTGKAALELTGSRGSCGLFYDLANTFKFLAKDEESNGFWWASGCYDCNSNNYPLSSLLLCTYYGTPNNSVGWIVLEK